MKNLLLCAHSWCLLFVITIISLSPSVAVGTNTSILEQRCGELKVHSRAKLALPGGIAWSHDGRELAVYSEIGSRVAILNVEGSKVAELRRDTPYAGNSIAFLLDQNLLITPSGNNLHGEHIALSIWDVHQSSPLKDIQGPLPDKNWRYNSANVFATSANGLIIASTSFFPNQPVTIYSAKDGTAQLSIPIGGTGASSDGVQSIALTLDGKFIAVGTIAGKIRVYNVKTGAPVAVMSIPHESGQEVGVVSLAFSPDGIFLASGIGATRTGAPTSNAVRIWRTSDGMEMSAFPHDLAPPIVQISWSGDGRYVAFVPSDKTIRIWPQSEPLIECEPVRIGAVVSSISFSDNSRQIAVSSGLDGVTIFDILRR